MSRFLRYRFLLCAPLLLLFFAVPTAHAIDPLSGLALGPGLDKFAGSLQTLIDKSVAGGEILEIGAGGQVAVAIAQAKLTYEADLKLTYANLNAAEQQTVNSLSSFLNDFEKKTYKDAADLEGRALAVTHSLPLSKGLPRLFSYDPGFTIQKLPAENVRVSLEGDFTDLMRKGFEPSLVVNGKTLNSLAKGNSEITFDVPFQSLPSQPSKVSSTLLTVHIPYKKGGFCLFHCQQLAEFRLPLAVLPLTAGTVTISYNTMQPGTDTKKFTCTAQSQESNDSDIKCDGENAAQAIHTCSPDPGYTLDPNTVDKFWTSTPQGKEGRGGDYWLERNCSSATQACLCFSTEHHRGGTSGKVYFAMFFQESKAINTNVPGSQQTSLKWSDNQIVTMPIGATWSGSYTRFDGKNVAFAGPYSDEYLHITQVANVVNLSTIP